MQEYRLVRCLRKTVSLQLDAFGVLSVYAPKTLPKKEIDAIVRKKESWIKRKREQLKHVEMALPPERLHGYSFYLFGEPCQIEETDEAKIRYDGESKKLYLPKTQGKAEITAWLKELAYCVMQPLTEKWAKIMGVSYTALKIKDVKSYWGCCTKRNEIYYVFRMAYAPPTVTEYLAIHELAHIRYKNHSRSFWAEVEKYCPDWCKRRKWLHDRRIFLHVF